MRVAHMIDCCSYGGESFFQTIQGGTDDVWTAAGYTVSCPRVWKYNDNGTYYYSNSTTGDPYNNNDLIMAVGPWQQFGLNVSWQRNAPTGSNDAQTKQNVAGNTLQDMVAKQDRWPNDGLVSTVARESIAPGITDYVNAQELAFVTGKRPFSEWDAYTKEWLAKGGKGIISAEAGKLGVPVPDYAK